MRIELLSSELLSGLPCMWEGEMVLLKPPPPPPPPPEMALLRPLFVLSRRMDDDCKTRSLCHLFSPEENSIDDERTRTSRSLSCAAEQSAAACFLIIFRLPHSGIFSSLSRNLQRTDVHRGAHLHRGQPRRRRSPGVPGGQHRGRVPVAEGRKGERASVHVTF